MKSIFAFLILASVLFSACKKDEMHNSSGQVVVTGTNKLIISVVHHTYSLPGIRVFLKNNTTEYPGPDTTLYDWSTTSDPTGIAVFDHLFEGNYFIYAKGFDPNIGMDVIGGSQAVLNSSTLTNKEMYLTLYVTE
jgi:hypothetical protein